MLLNECWKRWRVLKLRPLPDWTPGFGDMISGELANVPKEPQCILINSSRGPTMKHSTKQKITPCH